MWSTFWRLKLHRREVNKTKRHNTLTLKDKLLRILDARLFVLISLWLLVALRRFIFPVSLFSLEPLLKLIGFPSRRTREANLPSLEEANTTDMIERSEIRGKTDARFERRARHAYSSRVTLLLPSFRYFFPVVRRRYHRCSYALPSNVGNL